MTKKNWEEVLNNNEEAEEQVAESEDKGSVAADFDTLQKELILAKSQVEEHWDTVLRTKAEINNLRDRYKRELQQREDYAIQSFFEKFIPVIDGLVQGLESSKNEQANIQSIREGFGLAIKMMFDVLNKFGVKEVDPINETFDSRFHEAILMQPNADVAPNTVLQVVQKGYQIQDRVIRPARVIVAKPTE